MNTQKISFFKKIITSIKDFEKYPNLAAEGLGTAISYLTKLIFIVVVILSIGLTYSFSKELQEGINYIKENFPNFEYKNGELRVETDKKMEFKNNKILFSTIIVDTKDLTEEQISEYENQIPDNENGLIILKDKAIMKNSALSANATYKYSEFFAKYGIQVFDKESLVKYTTGTAVYTIYIAICITNIIYLFTVYLLTLLIDTLTVAIIGNIAALVNRMKFKFSAIYSMAAYAMTLSVILELIYMLINVFVDYEIKYFKIMYTAVACIYVIAVIFIIKSDVLKRQMELTELEKEKQKVKQELEEQQRKEKEEQEKREQQEKDKKKKEKEKPQENPMSPKEEPKGSEA